MVYLMTTEDLADADLDNTFAALSHPTRREIVRYLATQPTPPTMSAVATATGVSPQMLNKHALILERAGIAHRAPSGREKHLVVNVNALADAHTWIARARAHWTHAFDNLESYAATLHPKELS